MSWLRNGVPIDTSTDSNFIISSSGSLLILQAKLSDTANYSCVAANVARQRTSPAALVTVFSKYQCTSLSWLAVMLIETTSTSWGELSSAVSTGRDPSRVPRPHLGHLDTLKYQTLSDS